MDLRGLKNFPGPGASWQLHHEHLCKCVHDTPVGAVLKAVETDTCEVFYSLYLHDFVMGVHRCKHKNPDLKALEVKVSIYQRKFSTTKSTFTLHFFSWFLMRWITLYTVLCFNTNPH